MKKASCAEIDPLVTPYVDGLAEDEPRALVEAHLTACPECRERALAERTARQVVRSRAAILAARAPADLVARCAQAASDSPQTRLVVAPPSVSRLRQWAPLALAATLLITVAATFMQTGSRWRGSDGRLQAGFAAQLAIDHTKCFGLSDVRPGLVNPAQEEARLRREFGWDMVVPAGGPTDFDVELQEVRECLYAGGTMAHIMYRHEGRPLSLFMVPEPVAVGDGHLEIVGHDAVIWSRPARTYVLVGQEVPAEMSSLAGYLRGVAE